VRTHTVKHTDLPNLHLIPRTEDNLITYVNVEAKEKETTPCHKNHCVLLPNLQILKKCFIHKWLKFLVITVCINDYNFMTSYLLYKPYITGKYLQKVLA